MTKPDTLTEHSGKSALISMKLLLIITAVLEAAAGLGLLVIPAVAIPVLLGVPLDTPAGFFPQ
jgi:hypothetical protein